MDIKIINRGIEDYQVTWGAMRAYTDQRTADSSDQIWLVQHPPVFTQGQAGKPEHILDLGNIPLVQTDRGGQITYHGPGQLLAYLLIELQRYQLNIRQLISQLEQAVIDTLSSYGINAISDANRPGVYVNKAKICSIGLRIRRGYSYHGLALNIDMDLTPFLRINPCGFVGIEMTQVKNFVSHIEFTTIAEKLSQYLLIRLQQSSKRI